MDNIDLRNKLYHRQACRPKESSGAVDGNAPSEFLLVGNTMHCKDSSATVLYYYSGIIKW